VCIHLRNAYDCTTALGRLMVLFNELFDPGRLSGPAGFSLSHDIVNRGGQIDLHIQVVGTISSASFHNRSRVQVVRTDAVDDDLGLLRQLIELCRVELHLQNVCESG
jgi:hypothetical protein